MNFKRTYLITVEGDAKGQPLGWGTEVHETRWIKSEIRTVITDAVSRFYQTKLNDVTVTVECQKEGK